LEGAGRFDIQITKCEPSVERIQTAIELVYLQEDYRDGVRGL